MPITKELRLKRNIMRRVYLAYVLKTLASPKGFQLLVVAFFLAELSPFSPHISVGHVIANMPKLYDLKALLIFEVSAFLHTEVAVKASLVSLLLVLAFYVYGAISKLLRSGMPLILSRIKAVR